MLAERLAASLVHHEPGWRLPRNTALARRYNVSPEEIEAAIQELTARHLLRRLPSGQAYRASPAHYLITLEGVPGLGARIDPMGASIACAGRTVSLRRIPEDVAQILGLPPGEQAMVIRSIWTANGQQAALSTTYLPSHAAGLPPSGQPDPSSLDTVLNALSPAGAPAAGPACHPVALQLEVEPPPPSVARSLRLAPGEPAVSVTVQFADPSATTPVALTVAVLHPGFFRIIVQSRAPRQSVRSASQQAQADEGWNP